MGTKLKVLTLNCWGVPVPYFGGMMRTERFIAIADELSKAQYDIVVLQEVFSQANYETLCAKLLTVFPYTHYFHSGCIGSGLCIFSKHLILETQTFPYTLNGYAHKVLHGDWYAGKAIGLAKILVNGARINVYTTHLHAEYSRKKEYKYQRLNQAFELSQVMKNTSESCDAAFAAGDFNCSYAGIHYNLIAYNGNFKDAWLTQKRKVVSQEEGNSCGRSDNCFTKKKNASAAGPGERLDFIFYRNNTGCSIDCDKCYITMQKIPGTDYNFSDHDGVAAEFHIRKNLTAMCPPRQSDLIEKHMLEARELIESGIHKVHSNQIFFAVSAFLCLVALVFSADGSVLGYACPVIQPLFTLLLAILIWNAIIVCKIEFATLTTTKKDIENIIRSNPS